MADVATVMISGGLFLLTAILAWYTRTLAIEAKSARLLQIQPCVVVTIEPSKFLFYMELVIVNTGMGVARNVTIEANPDISLEGEKSGKTFNELSFLNWDILKPGQEIRHSIGSFRHYRECPTSITSKCYDVIGNQHIFTTHINVAVLEGITKIGEDPSERIANGVEKILATINRSDFRKRQIEIVPQK
ncbi:hypothetical protein [Pseudodesulfovibrio mercurii]|uniref:hypothetical protein n=1 Tax=Pseudodesulfovibrio mercurii TaxID=641491 RepID=UPI0011D2A9CF|nr:hypothetical protein [Pseudodesulfovibrio mercurii]